MNKVSIIMPAFNASKYLKRSIESILKQKYENFELIIIDDGSTDDTKKFIKEYAMKDNRIMPIYSEINQGVSKSRNMGLKICSGDYVLFIDADDYITKDCIKIMVEKAIKYNADVLDSYHMIIDKNKKFLEHKQLNEDLILGDKNNTDMLTVSSYVTGKLIKKELLKGLLFNEELRRYEDLVFEHQLKLKLNNYVLIKDVLYYYYQVSDSLINTLGEKHKIYMDAAKEVLDLYKNESKEAKLKIESLLFTNAFLTGITKVVKNDKSNEENTKILREYLNKFSIFKTYKENKYISKFIKNRYEKTKSDKKLYNLIKITRKINFINIYFKFLSLMYKYSK